MGAPKGNQFWKLRSKHGRDKLFATPELMWEAACEYFQYTLDNPLIEVDFVNARGRVTEVEKPHIAPFTIQGLCLYMDCNVKYFNIFDEQNQGKTDQISKDFNNIITRIRETIFKQKFEGAACGFYNANLISRELGLADKSENKTEHSGNIQITGMEIILNEDKV